MTKSTEALDLRTQSQAELENLRLEIGNKQIERKELDQTIFELNGQARRQKTNHHDGRGWQSEIHQARYENLQAKAESVEAQQEKIERDIEAVSAEIKRLEPLTLKAVAISKADIKASQAAVQEAESAISDMQQRIADAEAIVATAKEYEPDLEAIEAAREEMAAAVSLGEKTQADAKKLDDEIHEKELRHRMNFRKQGLHSERSLPALRRRLETAQEPLQAARDRLSEVTKAYLENEFEKSKVLLEKELPRVAVAFEAAIGLGMLAKGNPRRFGEGDQLANRFKAVAQISWQGCMGEQRDRLENEGIEV